MPLGALTDCSPLSEELTSEPFNFGHPLFPVLTYFGTTFPEAVLRPEFSSGSQFRWAVSDNGGPFLWLIILFIPPGIEINSLTTVLPYFCSSFVKV